MNSHAVYHRAPYPLRVAIASARGVVLQHRRYSRDTRGLVAEALGREAWSPEEWADYQAHRLERVLLGAREHVAAYQGFLGRSGEPVPSLERIPLLEKERLRANPQAFVRDDAPRRLVAETTSGTTATPLSLWISRTEYRRWYALFEARWRSWYGVSGSDRWGIIGGQPVVPPGAEHPPFWVWNAGMRQLYLSSYHIAPHTAAAYARAIHEHRITYLLGYPSSLYALALACREMGVRPRRLRVVIGNAEPVLEHQREVIGEVFGCPVRETYGMAEFVAAASECDAGRLHLWPEVGVLEVLDHTRLATVGAGSPGRLVCTSLLNATMPLIRYVVGDTGALAPTDTTCGCGRTLPMLASLEGRSDDLVTTADGRFIGRLDPVFKGTLPIAGAQIIQEDLGRFRVLVVPAPGYGEDAAASITRRLKERVGEARVEIELIDRLPTGANGKFKAVISRVPVGER